MPQLDKCSVTSLAVPNYEKMKVEELRNLLKASYPEGPPPGSGISKLRKSDLLERCKTMLAGSGLMERPANMATKLELISDGGAEEMIICWEDYGRMLNLRPSSENIVLETAG